MSVHHLLDRLSNLRDRDKGKDKDWDIRIMMILHDMVRLAGVMLDKRGRGAINNLMDGLSSFNVVKVSHFDGSDVGSRGDRSG